MLRRFWLANQKGAVLFICCRKIEFFTIFKKSYRTRCREVFNSWQQWFVWDAEVAFPLQSLFRIFNINNCILFWITRWIKGLVWKYPVKSLKQQKYLNDTAAARIETLKNSFIFLVSWHFFFLPFPVSRRKRSVAEAGHVCSIPEGAHLFPGHPGPVERRLGWRQEEGKSPQVTYPPPLPTPSLWTLSTTLVCVVSASPTSRHPLSLRVFSLH